MSEDSAGIAGKNVLLRLPDELVAEIDEAMKVENASLEAKFKWRSEYIRVLLARGTKAILTRASKTSAHAAKRALPLGALESYDAKP
jgi:metal-responsive CopG/Arc/MetJ family transcriptional regulator